MNFRFYNFLSMRVMVRYVGRVGVSELGSLQKALYIKIGTETGDKDRSSASNVYMTLNIWKIIKCQKCNRN